jgi:hypothetical protein
MIILWLGSPEKAQPDELFGWGRDFDSCSRPAKSTIFKDRELTSRSLESRGERCLSVEAKVIRTLHVPTRLPKPVLSRHKALGMDARVSLSGVQGTPKIRNTTKHRRTGTDRPIGPSLWGMPRTRNFMGSFANLFFRYLLFIYFS